MKKTNKIISILLVIAMMLTIAPLTVIPASAAPDTDYTGYYKITNAGNLAWFACLVVGDTSQSGITEAEPDAKAVLTADIDITVLGERLGKSWVGIGTEEIPFTGVFDGNGYTIKGLTTDTSLTNSSVATVAVDTAKQGLFGVIGEGGVVRDVIVEGTATLSDSIQYGGICSENNGTIENVVSMINVTGGDNADVFCHTNNGTITNSFADKASSVQSVTAVDAATLASGSVAYALGASFGQTIGTDTQPVHFNGENTVYKAGDVYTNTKPDIPDLGEARIYDTSVNLGIDLSVKFYVEIGEDIEIENIRLRTVSPSGVLKDLPVDTDGTGNPLTVTKGIHTLYVFTLNGITPQCIGNTIEAQLYHNDIIMDCDNSGLNTSIKEILIGIYDSSDDNTKQLIIDTLEYGAASQVYRDYKTDALVTDGFEPATQDVDKEVPENKPVLTDDSSAVDIFTNVSYGATNYLMFGLSGNVDFTGKVTVNDAPVTGTMQGSYYVVKTETISAKDLGKDFTVKYTGDDGAVTLTYSINDYCYTAYTTSTNQKMIDLAQALYNYGLSAHIYSGEHELGNEQTCMGYECEICRNWYGETDENKHTNYTYTASGNTITETCGLCKAYSGTLTISAPADLYVDGTTAKEAVVDNQLADTSVTYEVTYSTADGSAPTVAGTYTASVTVGGATASVEFTLIKQNSSVVTAPTANTLTYNSSAQELITAGSANGGEMQYSLDGTDYSETIPAGTNAGDYTVYYKVIGDANHNDSEPAAVTVTISKKEVTASATVQDKIYDGTTDVGASAIEIKFDGIVDGDDFEVSKCMGMFLSPNAGNNKTIYVTYDVSGEDVNNYDIYEDGVSIPEKEYYYIETKANILPRDISDAVIVLGNALTYNGAEQTQEVTSVTVDGLYVTYTVSGDTATNVGVYELTITANTNFTGTKTVLYTINPDLSGIEGLDQYNVKSTNKADVENVYNQLDNAVTDLASADKKAEWKGIKDECWQWLKILESVAYKVESLGNSHLAYDIDTVTSADDEALESLEAEMYLFMRDYRDNMTEEELLKVDNARIEISKLRDRIAETKSEYERVIAAANGYDEATVTSADKNALVQLNDDIYALALTDNVTADELENLENAHDKVLGLIDKLTGISDEIKRIIEAVDKYVFESVKSSDKADIQQLIADIKALLDTQNITADERTLLESADETCDKLIAKIDETVAEINRINDATNAYDIDTVTSADKADIEKLLADIKALTDGDNITADERKQLEGNETTLKALLDKIGATADEIARIENAVNSYDETTVKSTDKADLEKLIEDIKALTDATNITEDERTNLEALDATSDKLIKKIDDTAAEIARIDEAVNAYDEETVKSSDIPALGKLIDDIKALTDGDNITEDEKAALEETDKAIDELVEKLAEVAEEIKRVDEAVKSYDEETVKSSDSEDLAQLKDDVQSLIDSNNTTENEKTVLGEMAEKIEALENKITEIEEQLEKIGNIENGYDPETVTSDDKAAIENAIAEIEAVNPNNLTDEQKAEYEEIKAEFETLLDEIEVAEKAVADIGIELEMFDENRVTIFWEDDIEALKAKIDEVLADENMGEAEKAKLNEYKAQADKLIEIINTPKEYISCRFFYFIWDCLTWKYNGILWLFSKIFGFELNATIA